MLLKEIPQTFVQTFLICGRNGDLLDRLDYQVGSCEHFTHSSENGSIVAALSNCHDGKFVSGFLATKELRFDISNTNSSTGEHNKNSRELSEVKVDLVSSLPETSSSLIDPSILNALVATKKDGVAKRRSATIPKL